MNTIETFDMNFLVSRQHIMRAILTHCPKEIFVDNYHVFRLFEYLKCFDRIINKFSIEEEFTYVDVGSCRSYLPYFVAQNFPCATVYMTDVDHVPDYFLWGEPAWPDNLKFEKANCQTFCETFAEQSVDVVSCISVIEHVDDERLAYNEMLRCLKVGGSLVMTTDIDVIGPLDFHPRRFNSAMFKKRHDEINSAIPYEIDVDGAGQVAKVASNKALYKTLGEDIKKEFEMFGLHYLAGFYEIIKI